MNNFIIDTHCHLNMEPFKNDLDSVIRNASDNNVKYMQTICTKLEEAQEVREIAEKYDNIYCSAGLHPCNVTNDNVPTPEKLLELTSYDKVISYGETGLDYFHDETFKNSQKISFISHMNASSINKLPIIVHTRDAENDTADLLKSEMNNAEFTGVIHCFTASYEFAKKALDLGLYISIAGIVTFKNAKELQETVAKLPLDRLLVETDAPYLAPMPHRGKRNEPGFTMHTAKYLAGLLRKPYEEICEVTTKNAQHLFSKAKFI